MSCEKCLMFTHCRYDLHGKRKPCEHFKNNSAIKKGIVSKLKHCKSCWQALADRDSLYLQGKIEAMEMAIRIVDSEFDKAERGVTE